MPKIPDTSLADDLLHGARAIGEFIGLEQSATFYQLQRGHIPAAKRGAIWVASKARLKAHFSGDVVEPKRQAATTEINTIP